jgi:hypothetical protein
MAAASGSASDYSLSDITRYDIDSSAEPSLVGLNGILRSGLQYLSLPSTPHHWMYWYFEPLFHEVNSIK